MSSPPFVALDVDSFFALGQVGQEDYMERKKRHLAKQKAPESSTATSGPPIEGQDEAHSAHSWVSARFWARVVLQRRPPVFQAPSDTSLKTPQAFVDTTLPSVVNNELSDTVPSENAQSEKNPVSSFCFEPSSIADILSLCCRSIFSPNHLIQATTTPSPHSLCRQMPIQVHPSKSPLSPTPVPPPTIPQLQLRPQLNRHPTTSSSSLNA